MRFPYGITHHELLPYGGPDGEMGASMRYLSQRYTMPYKEWSENRIARKLFAFPSL